MIAYIKGKILEIKEDRIIIENNGVGYEVFLCENHLKNLKAGNTLELFISSSFSMYEGLKLYGFTTSEEKDIFELLKTSIPNTGAKKAMDYLNKILKSTTDFKNAVITQNTKLLKTIFGFTPKTADRLIQSLKDKIDKLNFSEEEKLISNIISKEYDTALNALVNLGFKATDAKLALNEVLEENRGKKLTLEDLIKYSLSKLSKL